MKRAFTLIELSIVLIIIGLLVGGVLAGRELIDAARQQATVSELRSLETAFNTFRLKYDGLPGDIDIATDLWAGTANGNDNGSIQIYNEAYRAWQHLSLAGLVDGQYTGTHSSNFGEIGVNSPASEYDGAGYSIFEHTVAYFGRFGHQFSLGGENATNVPTAGGLEILQAQGVDAKIDDGIANTGRFYAMDGGGVAANGCSNPHSSAGADYNFASTVATPCRVVYWYD